MPQNNTEQQGGGTVEVPTQSEEVREVILNESAAGSGTATATGQQRAVISGEQEIPQGEDRGAKQPIAGGDEIVADAAGNNTQKPVGLMAEDAFFTHNGTVNPTFVGTPAGPVPVGSVTNSVEEANKRLAEHHKMVEDSVLKRRGAYEAVDQATIDRLSGAELRSIAQDRGYDLGEQGGNRTTRRRFARAQAADKEIGEQEEADEGTEGTEGKFASKAAEELAEELGVSDEDLESVEPSGASGGYTVADVRAAAGEEA